MAKLEAHETHLPVLRVIGAGVRYVVEFGAGDASTRTFLDRTFYPALDRLVSYEHNLHWIARIRSATANDSRWVPILASEAEAAAAVVTLPTPDLVFVDSATAAGRREILRALAARFAADVAFRPPIVVHDAPEYADALALFPAVRLANYTTAIVGSDA